MEVLSKRFAKFNDSNRTKRRNIIAEFIEKFLVTQKVSIFEPIPKNKFDFGTNQNLKMGEIRTI